MFSTPMVGWLSLHSLRTNFDDEWTSAAAIPWEEHGIQRSIPFGNKDLGHSTMKYTLTIKVLAEGEGNIEGVLEVENDKMSWGFKSIAGSDVCCSSCSNLLYYVPSGKETNKTLEVYSRPGEFTRWSSWIWVVLGQTLINADSTIAELRHSFPSIQEYWLLLEYNWVLLEFFWSKWSCLTQILGRWRRFHSVIGWCRSIEILPLCLNLW